MWASQHERDRWFESWTISHREALRRGVWRPHVVFDPAAVDAAREGLSRPERTLRGGAQLVVCPECGSSQGRHLSSCSSGRSPTSEAALEPQARRRVPA